MFGFSLFTRVGPPTRLSRMLGGNVSRTVLLILAGFLGFGCTTQLPGPRSPRPVGSFATTDIWRDADGYDISRMVINGGSYPLYRTLWVTSDGEELLLCLQYPGGELFGTRYNVFIYDNKMRMLRHGELVAQQDDEPLAIVEVRPTSEGLPESRNGKWQLAVVLADRSSMWNRNKPLRLVGFGSPDETANYVMCELVSWSDQLDKLPFGSGNLSDATRIEYRTAERNWPVNASGNVLIDLMDLPHGAP